MKIKNLTKAANRIKKAVAQKERIILYGDADLDGISSVIIAHEAIQSLGGSVAAVYFPDREKEGYGITPTALDLLKPHAPALLVAFDLGISNFEEIPLAKKMGFDVIVVDHHKVIDKIPKADVVVDPKQPGDTYPFKEFAACGLSFRLAEAILGKSMSENVRKSMVELAALGTIADMMVREQDNIAIIEEGMEALPYSWRPGIRAFLESDIFLATNNMKARVQQMIGILNVRDAKNGQPGAYRLLTSVSLPKAKVMLDRFVEKNKIRREKIEDVTEEVRMRIFHKKEESIIFEGGKSFEFMLLGAVASIISQDKNKPTFIYKEGKNEILGSVRAPSGYDTVEAMNSCAEFLETYGGHPQASGFRTSASKTQGAKTCLMEYFTNKKMKKFTIQTDGGSRGNPGPAAIGAAILNEQGVLMKEISEYIGETTNNEAEYRAPITALKKLKSLIGKTEAKQSEVGVFADSELLVKQMNGQYKVENPKIQEFFLELWNLKIDFVKVTFTAVPREQNKHADRLVNEALDGQTKARSLF